MFYYAQHIPDGKRDAWDVAATCRLSPATVRAAETELVGRGVLVVRGERRFVLTPPSAEAPAEVQGAEKG